MTPAELTLVILAVVQTALLVWLLVLVRRKPADSSRTPDFEALGRGLEGPFKRLAAEWEAERRRLAEQTAQAGELVARLTRLDTLRPQKGRYLVATRGPCERLQT